VRVAKLAPAGLLIASESRQFGALDAEERFKLLGWVVRESWDASSSASSIAARDSRPFIWRNTSASFHWATALH
jgi:hypothetical protein